MPIIKSAKKRMRQTIVRRSRNQATKRTLREESKVFAAAVVAKDATKAAESLKNVQSNLDKAVKKNILKKNTAARKLARLTAQAKAIGAKSAPTAAKKVTAKKPITKAAPKKKVVAKKPVAKKAAPKKTVAKKPAAKK
jgi:small subunit ribosomal protein S20